MGGKEKRITGGKDKGAKEKRVKKRGGGGNRGSVSVTLSGQRSF